MRLLQTTEKAECNQENHTEAFQVFVKVVGWFAYRQIDLEHRSEHSGCKPLKNLRSKSTQSGWTSIVFSMVFLCGYNGIFQNFHDKCSEAQTPNWYLFVLLFLVSSIIVRARANKWQYSSYPTLSKLLIKPFCVGVTLRCLLQLWVGWRPPGWNIFMELHFSTKLMECSWWSMFRNMLNFWPL